MRHYLLWLSCLFLVGVSPLHGDDSEDLPLPLKQPLQETNRSLRQLHQQLTAGEACLRQQVNEGEVSPTLLAELRMLKAQCRDLQIAWRDTAGPYVRDGDEALPWDTQEGTVGQLISDYAPPELVYLVPPDLAGLRIHLHTRLPLPESCWENFLEIVLAQCGVGIRKPHPLLRDLYLLTKEPTSTSWFLADRQVVQALSPSEHVSFFMLCQEEDPAVLHRKLQGFVRPQVVQLAALGDYLVISAPASDVVEVLKVVDFLSSKGARRDYKLMSVSKTSPDEMAKLLSNIFHGSPDGKGATGAGEMGDTLRIHALNGANRALLLVGSPEQLRRAEQVAMDLERRLEDPAAKTIYAYQCQHSPPEELAQVLERVYCMLQECDQPVPSTAPTGGALQPRTCLDYTRPCFSPPNCPAGPVNLQMIGAGIPNRTSAVSGSNNFIVDAKSGSILMVVEQRLLPALQDLARRMDVPKRMVQLDVLLVERRIKSQNRFGLNLLRIGSLACDCTATGLGFDGRPGHGLFEFILSREKTCSTPAYDLTYNFLLNQEDVQINANPSVLTVNQTPASISLVEEMSINNGAVSCCDTGAAVIQKSYVRAQYGITLVLTPTIHLPDSPNSNSRGSVTLDTNITFDTTRPNCEDRPDVVRRHIENQVRVGDGETVILGGLRRRVAATDSESIPFLGEIPGLGKLFSSTMMDDNETEMFIFITPRLILDPQEELRRVRAEELCRRPGDVPEFLACIQQAKERASRRAFARTVQVVTGEWADAQECFNPGAPDARCSTF